MSVEYAHGPRGRDTFPRHWGTPEGETSEERSLWIFRNIATDQMSMRFYAELSMTAGSHSSTTSQLPSSSTGRTTRPCQPETVCRHSSRSAGNLPCSSVTQQWRIWEGCGSRRGSGACASDSRGAPWMRSWRDGRSARLRFIPPAIAQRIEQTFEWVLDSNTRHLRLRTIPRGMWVPPRTVRHMTTHDELGAQVGHLQQQVDALREALGEVLP